VLLLLLLLLLVLLLLLLLLLQVRIPVDDFCSAELLSAGRCGRC